ncbi:MAG TPA: hypothetical protein VK335_34015 [Bryobacteraceae bacterium]|nr:hypothetical protein [Bryobacteraceae bacterium]
MLVVVGGHTRNIGKTSVVAGLISALPEFHWTALKITQYGNDVCSTDGEPCECTVADAEHPFAITEEIDRNSATDTSRFLAAGARQAYWVRTAAGQLGYALPAVRRILEAGEHVIAESNSLLQFIKPDLYLVVVDFGVRDFKPTSLHYLDRADALVVIDRGGTPPAWSGVARRLWESKPRFRVQPPQWVTEAMAALVRGRLNSSTTPSGAAEPRASTAPPFAGR